MREHWEGASNKARFQVLWTTFAGVETYFAGADIEESTRVPNDVIAIRATHGHTATIFADRDALGWRRIPHRT